MNEDVMAYLNEAIDYIQQHSVRREHIDWPALRQEVYALAAHAQTPAETYPAIERALQLLGDHHSSFSSPQREQLIQEGKVKRAGLRATYPEGIIGLVEPGSPAESAGVEVGDRIETINGQSLTALTREQLRSALVGAQLDLTLRSGRQGSVRQLCLQASAYEACWLPQGRRLEHNIGYLLLPATVTLAPGYQAYAKLAQQIIREIDQVATCGWIIDLRPNIGGGCWKMWAGVGPVLGEGEFVFFVSPGEKINVIYRGGKVYSEQDDYCVEVEEPYELQRPWPPVAVLTSQLTISAGEFVLLAFRGRPRTCSFGEATYGVPTGNSGKKLSDGAQIILTESLGADRTGQTYDSSLLPDQPVKIDWRRLGTDDDPVLQAAIQWLHTEEGCL